MSNNNLDKSLIEVRKAYRILFDYQTRILDLISYISSKTHFTYNGGYSKFSNSGPNNGRGKLDLWAWDWLNFYFYEFYFGKLKDRNNNEYTFSIFHLADDGFYQAQNKIGNRNKTDVKDFLNEYDSNSKLIFVLGKNTWDDSWGQNWNSVEFTLKDSEVKIDEEKFNGIVFKSYNLNKFDCEENVSQILLDFKSFCENNNMSFHINSKIL